MQITSAVYTHKGLVRGNNEDNYYLCGRYKKDVNQDEDSFADELIRDTYLYAVCDGMGGEEHGERASLIAVQTLDSFKLDFDSHVLEYIKTANQNICNYEENASGMTMGSTMTVLSISNRKINLYNIGDSRIYKYSDNQLEQLSVDHTQAQRLVDMGIISADKMNSIPEKHKLTQHLGIPADEIVIEPYMVTDIPVTIGNQYLLCSDGLTDMCSDIEIAEILNSKDTPPDKVKQLTDMALEKGGKDNITVLLVAIEETRHISWVKKLFMRKAADHE